MEKTLTLTLHCVVLDHPANGPYVWNTYTKVGQAKGQVTRLKKGNHPEARYFSGTITIPNTVAAVEPEVQA